MAPLLFIASLFFHAGVVNADEKSFEYRVFDIQKRLALKGNTLAQYKLGIFYEFGIATKKNANEAIVWYEKAAKSGNKPAANRLIYQNVKQHGYSKSNHSEWVHKIIKESAVDNVHSLIILGQLHHNGLAVVKDLRKAAKILHKASSLGRTEVDFEVEEIKRKIRRLEEENKEEEIIAPIKKKAKIKQKTVIKQKPPIVDKPKKVLIIKEVVKDKASIAKENKRLKYEEVMRKLRQEELILQQQQDWSEDGGE